jgi:mRNA interferase MazF
MTPDRGDVVWLELNPQAGREQAGHRPVIVLSPAAYNRQGLMLCCPITSKVKGYPFEVVVRGKAHKIAGVALADHVKCLDWQSRGSKKVDAVEDDVLAEISGLLKALLVLT